MMLFGFFALVLVAVYWVNRAVLLFDDLIADGQSAWVFLEFTALTLPNVVWLVLPVAAFVAAVYGTNRLMTESELVVLQATGFSPYRLARPVLYFGLIVALLMSVLGHVLVPASRARLSARNDEIAQNVTARILKEGVFIHPAAGITVYIQEVTPAGELRNIFLSDSREPGQSTTYTAERAMLVKGEAGPKLVMFDGMAQHLTGPDARLSTTRFADFAYDIGALISPRDTGRQYLSDMPTHQLVGLDDATLRGMGTNRLAVANEIHDRFVQPLLAPVAALLGFAALLMGGFSRFGLWQNIAAAVALLVVVKMIGNATVGMAQKSATALPLLYLPIVFGLLIAALMLWLSARSRSVRTGASAT